MAAIWTGLWSHLCSILQRGHWLMSQSYLLLVAPPGPGIFKSGGVPLLLRNLREQDVVELRGVPRQVRGAPPVPRAGSC